MLLPDTIKPAQAGDPRLMVIYGREKSGKSSLIAQLPNCLAVDFEQASGYRFLDALYVHTPTVNHLWDLFAALEKHKAENGKNKYKYIALDHGTELERLAEVYATWQYKQLPVGKKYEGKLLDLPNGAGYYHLRNAFIELLERFQNCCETLILICNTNTAQIVIDGTEMTEMSMQLTGKLREIVGGRADAIGFLYREGSNNILNMRTDGKSIHEARPQHLRGKKIVLGESDDKGVITSHWDEVFINLHK